MSMKRNEEEITITLSVFKCENKNGIVTIA